MSNFKNTMEKQKLFEVRNISVSTIDGNSILNNISFYINEQEKVLLEGENGIGKSTLINSIFKNPNYKITEGQISYFYNNDFIDITNTETFNMSRLGLFFALQTIPEIEGLSTIKFLHKAYENLNQNKIDYKSINILDFKNILLKYCEDFNFDKTLLDRDLNVGFSGGERKQALLIHMLALKPKIIFADEPESGVDKDSTEKVYKVLNYLVDNGSSVLIISHNEKSETNLKIDRKYILKYNENIEKVIVEGKLK